MPQLSLFDGSTSPPPKTLVNTLATRERPAYRVLANSPACNLQELLASLIGGPRQMESAQSLLHQFGSLHGLARANAADLASVLGVGETAAARLLAAVEISRRLLQPADASRSISSPADAAAILQPLLMHREQEYLYVLLLDTRNRVMGDPREIYHGSLNTSLIRVGEVFRDAVKVNAAAIIAAHNHPSSIPDPSPEDVAVTRILIEAGKLLDVDVLDHLVIGDPGWVSLKERGLGFSST